MALRMTEEEFAEWKRKREQRQASPTCCQPARPSGVTLAGISQEEIERRYAEAERRGDVYALMFDPSAAKPLETARVEKLKYTEFNPAPPKRNKYGNQRVEVEGLRFDSKHEAAVYAQLMERVRAGELKCVMRQVKFDLGGGPNAARDSRYAYYADFVTVDMDNRIEVLDAKSEATRKNRTYINKRKQVLAEWGLDIREV